MQKLLQNFKYSLYRFMVGRYGTDNLNQFLIYLALGLIVINLFFNQYWISILVQICLILNIFRTFSKKINNRRKENQFFMTKTKKIRHIFSSKAKESKDKDSKYFVCPNCSQIVRVPKGRGHIEINCPNCRKTFDRRS